MLARLMEINMSGAGIRWCCELCLESSLSTLEKADVFSALSQH